MKKILFFCLIVVFYVAIFNSAYAYGYQRGKPDLIIEGVQVDPDPVVGQESDSFAKKKRKSVKFSIKNVQETSHKDTIDNQDKEPPINLLKARDERPDAPNSVKRGVQEIDIIEKDLSPGLFTKDDVVMALLNNLNNNPDWLEGLSVEQLKLKHVSLGPDANGVANLAYVTFIQEYEDLEVEGSYVVFTVRLSQDSSKIMTAQAKVYPELELNEKMDADISVIRNNAALTVGLQDALGTMQSEKRRLRYIEGKWRRIFEIKFAESDYIGLVDEDTHETWSEDDRLDEGFHGRVQGRGILFDTHSSGEDLETFDLMDLEIQTGFGDYVYTDSEGIFEYPVLSVGELPLTARLKGRWASIDSGLCDDLTFTGTAFLDELLEILFNPVGYDECSIQQVNGYYYTTRVHNWVAEILNDPQPINDINGDGQDDAITVWYTGGSAHYYASQVKIDFGANATSIYHEYGHFVDDMYGGITDNGLSEGWGDLFVAYVTGQPLIGIERFGPGTYMRSVENDNHYNGPGGGYYSGGVWSGFAWRLRQHLIESKEFIGDEGAAIDLAENLVIPVLESGAPGIPESTLEVLIRDDDDGILSNGTPHIRSIYSAAAYHRIPIPENDTISPGTVDDLIAEPQGLSRIKLQWTAPGDDWTVPGGGDQSGLAYFYDIRYSTSEIVTNYDFDAARSVENIPDPLMPGNLEELVVEGLSPGVTYYFAIKVSDNVLNQSGISNPASATTTAGHTLFSDDFETGAPGWTTQGSSSTVTWHLSNFRSNSPTTSFAYNNGDPSDPRYNLGLNNGSLISPPINLNFMRKAVLVFSQWFENYLPYFPGTIDYIRKSVEVSVDNGSTWEEIFLMSDNVALMRSWIEYSVDLSNYVGQTVLIRFKFDYLEYHSGRFNEGWYIDDVSIHGQRTPGINPHTFEAIKKDDPIPFEGSLPNALPRE